MKKSDHAGELCSNMIGFLILLYLICSLISYIRFIKNDFLLFVNFKGKCAVEESGYFY